MKVQIINPITNQPYPSMVAAGRPFFLVEAGQEFYVLVDAGRHGRQEYVVAVDGRDTLTNEDATLDRSGIISDASYLCKGFRVSASEVRTFTAVALGRGMTTAEKNGTAGMAGLVFAACYAEKRDLRMRMPARNYDGGGGRGLLRSAGLDDDLSLERSIGSEDPVSFGVGAAAGRQQTSQVGQTHWTRDASTLITEAVEYGDRESLAARGIVFPKLNPNWPLPSTRQAFADPNKL